MPRQRRKTSAPPGVAPAPPGVSRSQSVREIPADSQGDRQANAAIQGGAPMQFNPAAGTPASLGQPQPTPNDAFGPTAFPQEPPTAGIPLGPGPGGEGIVPDDPDMYLRAMLRIFPDPDLVGLIRNEAV